MTRAEWRAVYATLMDRFHYTPEQISKLTDRQIVHLCFHPRDDQGRIIWPTSETCEALPPAATLEEAMTRLEVQIGRFGVPPEEAEKARRHLRENWRG